MLSALIGKADRGPAWLQFSTVDLSGSLDKRVGCEKIITLCMTLGFEDQSRASPIYELIADEGDLESNSQLL